MSAVHASTHPGNAIVEPLRTHRFVAQRYMVTKTPTTWALLGGSVVMSIVFAIANLARLEDIATDESLRIAIHSATVPPLVFAAIAGAYATSTDIRYGLIDQRLLSDPRRFRWLAVNAWSSALLGLLYGGLGVTAAASSLKAYYAVEGVPLSLFEAPVLRAFAGTLLATPLLALIGVALGVLVPSQPGAIGAAVVWLFVIEPPLLLGVPTIGRWLPGTTAVALTYSPDPDLVAQLTGGLALALYATAFIAAARRRVQLKDF